VQRDSVSFRATHTHERSFVPTRNLLELSRQDVGLDIGDAVGSEFGPVGLDVGLLEGFSVGDNDVFGLVIGLADGLLVGLADGLLVGLVIGLADGLLVGLLVGLVIGLADGLLVGLADGLLVGFAVGLDAVIHVPSVI
jgi:hypothetical protein